MSLPERIKSLSVSWFQQAPTVRAAGDESQLRIRLALIAQRLRASKGLSLADMASSTFLSKRQLQGVETISGDPSLFTIISYLSQLDARLVVGVKTDAGTEWIIGENQAVPCSLEDVEL